jgi:elongator complex protein 1
VFFEKNGLRHGEFSLREPASTRVVELLWNSDSSVLAVLLQRVGRGGEANCEGCSTVVQLWTMKNYHYYLKQELTTTSAFTSMFWDLENALKLYTVSSGISRHFNILFVFFHTWLKMLN